MTSIVSQCRHGIDARCTPGGKISGQEPTTASVSTARAIVIGSFWLHSIREAFAGRGSEGMIQDRAERENCGNTNRDARRSQQKRLAQHHPGNPAGRAPRVTRMPISLVRLVTA